MSYVPVTYIAGLIAKDILDISFAYSMDPLRNKLYRFKGEYTLNKEATLREKRAVWERTAIVVPTIKDKVQTGSCYKD